MANGPHRWGDGLLWDGTHQWGEAGPDPYTRETPATVVLTDDPPAVDPGYQAGD